MHEIKHIGVFQAARFAAAMYLLLGAVIVIPLTFILMAFGGHRTNPFGLLLLLAPLLYAILGFVFTAIGCWVYNLLARMLGGIEIELEPKP